MTLIRKEQKYKKGDFMSIKDVAELLCCSAESIRTGAVGKFTLIPITDSMRPAYIIKTSDVQEFIKQRIELADARKK